MIPLLHPRLPLHQPAATYLDSLRVLLVKGADVESICGVDLTTWGDEWGWVLLVVHLIPVNAFEEWVLLQLQGTVWGRQNNNA